MIAFFPISIYLFILFNGHIVAVLVSLGFINFEEGVYFFFLSHNIVQNLYINFYKSCLDIFLYINLLWHVFLCPSKKALFSSLLDSRIGGHFPLWRCFSLSLN